MAIGADLRSTQVRLNSLRPHVAFGVRPTGLDKVFREYFFGLLPVSDTDSLSTMDSLISLLASLTQSELVKIEQLMLDIGTRADCDEGMNVASNVLSQKP